MQQTFMELTHLERPIDYEICLLPKVFFFKWSEFCGSNIYKFDDALESYKTELMEVGIYEAVFMGLNLIALMNWIHAENFCTIKFMD